MDAAATDGIPWPRTEILHNIEGVHGQGAAVIRVGRYKLLRHMQGARGFDGWCDVCNATECWMPPNSGPGAGPDGRSVARGGQLCCLSAPPSDANASASCPPLFKGSAPLPPTLLYDIEADPAERVDLAPSLTYLLTYLLTPLLTYLLTPQVDLAPSLPRVVSKLLGRLAAYNATNVPCCICTGSARTSEMDMPPYQGYWSSCASPASCPALPRCPLSKPWPRPAPSTCTARSDLK